MSASSPLKVYIKPGCPWCVDVVAWLKKEGYRFELLDVTAHPDHFREMVALSGQGKAPTMTCGDLLLADFGVEEMIPFLEKHGIRP